MALGNGSTTVPSTRIVSSLGFARTFHLLHDGRAERRAKTYEGRPTMLYESGPTRQSDISPRPAANAASKVPRLERRRSRSGHFGTSWRTRPSNEVATSASPVQARDVILKCRPFAFGRTSQ